MHKWVEQGRTSGVECCSGAHAGPHNRFQPHCQGDRTNPVINITKRRPHRVGRYAEDVLDNFLGPTKFCNDLFVGQGGEGSSVTPGVDGNVVLGHVLGLEEGGGGNGTRTNDEECRLERMLVKVLQQVGSVERRTVVVGKTPGIFCGTSANVRVANTTTTGPPTTAGVCGSLWIGRAPSNYGGGDIWYLNSRRLDLSDPLLDLWAVGRRNSVKLRVIRGTESRDWSSRVSDVSSACGQAKAYYLATEERWG